ncbi:MAG: glycosyltransferase family 2 protein [Micrococcus sp.]|nr:glycosyltransferase family 2 protein [Micrococcus sp.]
MRDRLPSPAVGVRAAVVVPSRGGAERLPRLVAALAAQQDAPDFEVHVVLDGDIDDSNAVLAHLAQSHPQLSLTWTIFPENRGRAAALNAGTEATTGHIVIRSDDDLEPGRFYVRDHVRAHDDFHGGVIGLPRNVLPATTYQRVYGDDADQRHARDAYRLSPNEVWRHWAGNVSAPRGIMEALGGYDERYRRYGWEDVDFGYRLHRAGYPVRFAPELETKHHAAAVTTEIRARRALHSGSSRQQFLQQHGAHALGADATPAGAWGLAVRSLAAVTTERTLGPVARAVDRAAGKLPLPVARKLIALVVEAAAETGRVAPHRATTRF